MPPRKAKASRRLAVVKEEPMDTSSTHVKEEPLPMVTTTNSSSKRVKEEPHYSPANTSDISSKRAKVSYPDHVILKMALRIQRVWRTNFRFYGTKSYAIGYLEVIPMKHIKSISFEAMVVFLREKPVIAIAKRFVQRLHLTCTFLYGSPAKALNPEHVNIRVVLAAYMIAVQPTQVFESMGVLEKSLFESAVVLTTSLEHLATDVARTGAFCLVGADMAESFPKAIFEFLRRFKAWKVPDEAKLTCRIKHALIALYQAEQQLPPDEPEDSKLRIEFRVQTERLRSKLQQIAGVGALAEFDQNCKSGVLKSPIGESCGPCAYAALPGRMSNEQLAHELLMDPMFQLSDTGDVASANPFYHRIRQSFHQAFWDSLVDDLKLQIPCYVRVIRVLVEIRDAINDLAGRKESHAINEAIDIDLIKQQTELGAFGWVCCKNLVASVLCIIMRIQAPSRDVSTHERWKIVGTSMERAERQDHNGIFCKALEFLLDLVNILRIDAANARLRLISPVIKDHGVDYERGKFQDKLNDGSLTLAHTKEWIKSAVKYEISSHNTTHADLASGLPKSFKTVLVSAMVALIVNTDPIKIENMPETLLFDFNRATVLQRNFHAIVDRITILATTTNALGNSSGKQQVLSDFTAFMVAGDEFDINRTLEKLGEGLDSHGILTDPVSRDKMFTVLKNCVRKEDAVRQLISSRIRKTLTNNVSKTTQVIDDKLMNVARQLLPLVDALAVRLAFLLDINRSVHTATYNSLIAAVVEEVAVVKEEEGAAKQ